MQHNLLDKLRERLTRPDKRLPKDVMLIAFLMGILLYVALLPVSQERDGDTYETQTTDTVTAESDYATRLARQLEDFLAEVEGVGRVQVLIYTTPQGESTYFSEEQTPELEGIVIAADGAGDETVRIRLMRMAMSLYGLEANKVEVVTLAK